MPAGRHRCEWWWWHGMSGQCDRFAGCRGDDLDALPFGEPHHLRLAQGLDDSGILQQADLRDGGGINPYVLLERNEERRSLWRSRGDLSQPVIQIRGTARVVQHLERGGESAGRL